MPPRSRSRVITAPLVLVLALLALGWRLDAAVASPDPGDEFSPLFARRLEVGLQEMDRPTDRIYLARLDRMAEDPLQTPASGNPVSVCAGSACYISYCLGSACLNSRCLGSACVVSGCLGSACVTSACGGSACIGSGCGGSACVGSVCGGSACTACIGPDPYEEVG